MVELSVSGMTCAHCVQAVTRAVQALDPSAQVHVDLGNGRVRVEGGSAADKLIAALGAAGYNATVAAQGSPAVEARRGCCGCA